MFDKPVIAALLDDNAGETVVPQESRFRITFELFQQFRNGEKNGNPSTRIPGLVDSHADEKDYELAFHFGLHSGINCLCHRTPSLLKPLIKKYGSWSRLVDQVKRCFGGTPKAAEPRRIHDFPHLSFASLGAETQTDLL